jgi:hypothetical protein
MMDWITQTRIMQRLLNENGVTFVIFGNEHHRGGLHPII